MALTTECFGTAIPVSPRRILPCWLFEGLTGVQHHQIGNDCLRSEMAIGAGGEEVGATPGVTRDALSRRPVGSGLSDRAIHPADPGDLVPVLNTCAIGMGSITPAFCR